MNKYIRGSLARLIVLLSSLIIVLMVSVIYIVKEDYFKDIDNTCRVLVHDQMNNILEYGYENKELKMEYGYAIIDLEGRVINSTEENLPMEMSLQSFSFDNWQYDSKEEIIQYNAPLIKNNKIENIVLFYIPKDKIIEFRNDQSSKWIYKTISFAMLIGIIITIYKIYKLVNKDILEPIEEMHKSSTEILKGNYLKKVKYDYYGEIGEFSHEFEKMRDGLLVASEEAGKLKVAEKELLACISHDLKTPIANISGYCEGIIDGVVKEEKDVKRYAGIILKKVKVLTKLLDDILELSKAEINQMSINKQEIYSKEFFEELLEEISMDVCSSGRIFTLEGEIPNLLMYIDVEKITQVMNNIISNSIKYTKRDGIINVSFFRINEGLEIRVKDDGIGIGANELSLVFDKFYRGEKHRNQNIPGSGLGLAIAKYIVEMHNGSIKLLSDKQNGTTVIIRIHN